MTKLLRKAFMTRSRLENRYYKTHSVEDKTSYKRQKNYYNRLYKRERKKYYSNINLNNIIDNKKFCSTLKPFLTDKCTTRYNICLIEEGEIISNDSAGTFNTFFQTQFHHFS